MMTSQQSIPRRVGKRAFAFATALALAAGTLVTATPLAQADHGKKSTVAISNQYRPQAPVSWNWSYPSVNATPTYAAYPGYYNATQYSVSFESYQITSVGPYQYSAAYVSYQESGSSTSYAPYYGYWQ